MGRRALQGLIMVLSLGAGFWFGGALTRTPSAVAIGAAAVCVLLGDVAGGGERWERRVVSALLAGLCFSGGWYLAGREIDAAYAECAQRGEEVRQALKTYHDVHHAYPESLSELRGVEIPGERILRPGLLDYSRTGKGYVLSFGDTLVRNTATDQQPFFYHHP